MKWLLHNRGYFSDDGQYELRPTYTNGSFAYHGRHIESDKLIASSADLSYVQSVCERHAASAIEEAPREQAVRH